MLKLIKNPIFLLIAGVSVFAILLVIGVSQAEPKTSGAKGNSLGALTTADNHYDFGAIPMKNGNVEHVFTLVNESETPVTLGEFYTSCMCTTAQILYQNKEQSKLGQMKGHGLPVFLGRNIQPGETFQVKVIFDPAAHGPTGTGPIHRIVYLETNSDKTPVIELNFDAVVTL